MTEAMKSIVAERERQRNAEGWTEEHDDAHAAGELARAAACYAIPSDDREPSYPPFLWPWDRAWWKPTPEDRRRELVKAGALILAEIERLDRAALRAAPPDGGTHGA